jgi:hypothetical protein
MADSAVHAPILQSPDGRSGVKARRVLSDDPDQRHMVLEVAGALGSRDVPIGGGLGTQLLWAPNSQAFAVTSRNEGAAAAYRTVVVGRANGSLETRDVNALIYRAFGHPVRCSWPEVPNVVAIAWLDGSRRLLVAAQIIHHTNCDGSGTFTAYEIDPWARRIIHTYDQLQAKHLFGTQLGPELLAADDDCLRQPPRCYVPANHPETATPRGPPNGPRE